MFVGMPFEKKRGGKNFKGNSGSSHARVGLGNRDTLKESGAKQMLFQTHVFFQARPRVVLEKLHTRSRKAKTGPQGAAVSPKTGKTGQKEIDVKGTSPNRE